MMPHRGCHVREFVIREQLFLEISSIYIVCNINNNMFELFLASHYQDLGEK